MKRLTRRSLRPLSLLCLLLPSNAQVKVSLRSSWPAPPLLAEILETVSMENPDGFFNYLDQLTHPDTISLQKSQTPEATHLFGLEVAMSSGTLQEPGSLAAVEMNLALHAATPRIEAFYHHYSALHNESQGSKCGSWVDWYGEVVCDVEKLKKLAGIETIDPAGRTSASLFPRPKVLSFDHIFPPPAYTLERPPRTAILYASLTSPNFRELHSYLLSLADRPDPHLEYVFRHIPPETNEKTRTYLSGYGVALDIKKMDYLALDDRHSHTNAETSERGVTNDENLDIIQDSILSLIMAHPENLTAPDSNTPLSEDELAVIGQQAAQLISDSSDPLTTLTRLSQNFPKYATSLARHVVVNSSVSDELHANSLKAQGGINLFWLNGAVVEHKDTNPFSLLRLLRKERGVMKSLTGLGLERAEAIRLITHPSVAAAQKDKGFLDGILDASDRLEGGDLIVWWNDMEKDSRYAQWNPSLFTLLRPTFPGQFPNVKRNLFNIILVLDLSQTTSLNFIAGAMANILNRSFPLRFGLVPIVETGDSAKMARLFYHLISTYGRKKTLAFITQISQVHVPPHLQTPTVRWDIVRAAFDDVVENNESPEFALPSLDAILNGDQTSTQLFVKVSEYVGRLGATLKLSRHGHAFFNGKHFDMGDDFLRQMQMEMGNQMMFLQEKIYEGSITDDNVGDVESYFYNLPTTSKRRNRYIYPTDGVGNLRISNLPEIFERARFRLTPSSYVYPAESEVIPTSLYVVADLDSEAGLELIKEALLCLDTRSRIRLSFIHNPSNSTTSISDFSSRTRTSRLISHLLAQNLLSKASSSHLLHSLGVESPEPAASMDNAEQIHLSVAKIALELTAGVSPDAFNSKSYADYVKASRLLLRELHIEPGKSVLIMNGRIVGPIEQGEFFAPDFIALEEYEFRKRTESVVTALKDIVPIKAESDRASFANLVAMSSSIIASTQLPDPSEVGLFDAPHRPRQRNYRLLESEYTAFEYGDNSTALYHVAVLVDPLSETAQKWSSVLNWLSNIPDIFIEIHLNPAAYPAVPLKRFYQYNLLPSLNFDDTGSEVPAQAVFSELPADPIYTLAMDVHSSWLVRPREALYDLDNIQIGKLSPGDTSVDAIFDLDYIVVEGHAREVVTSAAPRGVQLQLINGDSTPIDDTQIVANLGYFQFKAKPGVFGLEIRKGRGRKIYDMESVGNEGWESPEVSESGNEITVTSFEGLTLYPRLARRQGMQTEDVLEEDKMDKKSGFFGDITSSLKSMFKSKAETSTDLIPVKQQADINIFTVASGLLYERFVSIMILSVLRNTNSSVKFWFIENFLSPSFLEFIPHLAKQYDFQYELVTYKWPSWLRAQTEKQRIIWAYKILFLDVLFPMDLKKVIFVDADQIVRADLKELVDLDLHGAPYGYTPMGDDNLDMEGFRFWKTGYWKDFLNGRPYHISALYVIDLVRFRQMAAGDILRGQYQALSADPNSLSNLDQDLPNNLQREVPIFSLGEDWLWCETWCSKDRLHRAKTIDLCQNPLTKEPKLARARQIPEWEEYDSEIAQFARKLAEDGKIRSRMATVDTNVLAGGSANNVVLTSSENETLDGEGERTVNRDEL